MAPLHNGLSPKLLAAGALEPPRLMQAWTIGQYFRVLGARWTPTASFERSADTVETRRLGGWPAADRIVPSH